MKKLSETEYVYAAARIHSVDGALLGREKYAQLAAAPTSEAFSRMLGELGYKVGGDVFSALEEKLADAFAFVSEIAPAPEVFGALRCPYDCNNLKAAIKCEFVSGFEYSSLYSPCGTVSEKAVLSAMKNRDFSAFRKNMGKAATEAIEEYSKTRDPQLIDIILDRACCADMSELAAKSGEESVIEYVRDRTDAINLHMALRVIRMGKDRAFFESACAPGGDIGEKALSAAVEEKSEEMLSKAAENSIYAGLFPDGEFPSFAETERITDDAAAEKLKRYKHNVFGASPLLWYLCAWENEVKNIRMIIAGHAGAQPAEKIIERIRESYV